jgi:DNA polymerase-3 subunit beta
MNILEEKEGKLRAYFLPNQTMFEFLMKEVSHPEVQVVSRLIEGEYPNYEEIIPKKFKTHIIVKRDEFLNQIKAAALFSGKVNEIKIRASLQNKKIEVSARDSDIGESLSDIPAKIEGEDMEISFNHKFLADGLLNIKSSEVILELSREDGPCILKPVGDASYIYVVMPIKSV